MEPTYVAFMSNVISSLTPEEFMKAVHTAFPNKKWIWDINLYVEDGCIDSATFDHVVDSLSDKYTRTGIEWEWLPGGIALTKKLFGKQFPYRTVGLERCVHVDGDVVLHLYRLIE